MKIIIEEGMHRIFLPIFAWSNSFICYIYMNFAKENPLKLFNNFFIIFMLQIDFFFFYRIEKRKRVYFRLMLFSN